MKARLLRYRDDGQRTLGLLKVGNLVLHTIEQPWRNNEPFRSCVPDGDYKLIPWVSPSKNRRFDGRCLKIIGCEPARTDCLFHTANWSFELQGCVAPGLKRGVAAGKGQPAQDCVMSSTAAMEKLLETVTKPISLEIRTASEVLAA